MPFKWKHAIVITLAGVIWLQPATILAQASVFSGINAYRIADTSSPRDTIHSFLELSREMVGAWRSGDANDRVYVLLRGLQETLDFSDTVNGSQTTEQVRRVLLLREILDRVALPPFSEIPGAEDSTDAGQFWTIPGTRLRISRIPDGPRAGEFVFDAATVENLHLTYAMVRQLPYRSGAIPILDDWKAREKGALSITTSEFGERLSQIDGTSPRSVLTQFLRHSNNAFRIATDAEAQLSASPPTMTIEEARVAEGRAMAHLLRASTAFDMSRVSESRLENARIEATLILKEILDRVVLPPIHEVPDASDVRKAGDPNAPFVWELPGLSIKIVRVREGDRSGFFAFDPKTLENLEEIYSRLKELPYIKRLPLRAEWEYGGNDALSPGFYDFYISTPGSLVPSVSPFGKVVMWLPAWTKTVRVGQTTWQWIGLTVSMLAAIFASLAVIATVSWLTRFRTESVAAWIGALSPMVVMVIALALGWFVNKKLNLTGSPLEWFEIGRRLVVLTLAAWLIWRTFMAVGASVAATGRISERGVDASLVRVLCGVVAIVIAVALFVAGLRDIGVDAVPLIAGLGVGGLAVALAVRPTLENLIGGLILHSDRPLRIGDFCSIGGTTGTIEGIGVRSTKIRARDRTLITIPNARLADMDIVNWAHCDRMLITAILGLRYETTTDQIRHLLASIRRMLHAHPKIDRRTIRVRYAGPAASSRDVNIRVYILTRDWNEFHAIREDIFLRIDDLVEQSGVGYAFPSQTLYMSQDKMPDKARGAAAEAEVAFWRAANEMPFPRLTDKTMDDLEGTLDYPPRGSNRALHGEDFTEPDPEPLSDRSAETKS